MDYSNLVSESDSNSKQNSAKDEEDNVHGTCTKKSAQKIAQCSDLHCSSPSPRCGDVGSQESGK